jgi:hypothetical protein
MTQGKGSDRFYFHEPGNYRIRVFGFLGESLSQCLGYMRIVTEEDRDYGTITTIEGKLRDQAQLSGLLNLLYEHHFMLVSVQFMDQK